MVYRQASWIVPPQCVVIRFMLESLGLGRDVVEHILKCYELTVADGMEEWYSKDFSGLLL